MPQTIKAKEPSAIAANRGTDRSGRVDRSCGQLRYSVFSCIRFFLFTRPRPRHEFYQLLTYRDDVDLEKKLAVWERFYKFDRPRGAHGGKTPYEALREKLS